MNKNLLALLCCASMTSLHAMEDVLVLHSSANLNVHDGAPQVQSHARNKSRFTFDLETNASEQEKKFHDDVITVYQLQQGKVAADNPINTQTEHTFRISTQAGIVCEEYKKVSGDKDLERKKLAQQLKMTKLLMRSRLKKIVVGAVVLGMLSRYPFLLPQGEYTSGAFKAYVHMLQTVAAICGNAVAENINFVFNLSAELLLSNPQILIAVLAAGTSFVLNYLAGTYTLWRDTKNLSGKIAELENSKDCAWEFVRRYNEYRPLVTEKDMRKYADKITAGLQKQLQDAHEVVVDINNLNSIQQALQPSVNN